MNKTQSSIISILFFISFTIFPISAQNKFEWKPVTDEDWKVNEDTVKLKTYAIIIFERAIADDRELSDKDVYYSVYRRIRILGNEGKKWGEVSVYYNPSNEEVLEVEGRVLLRDGTEIQLQKSEVRTKEIVKVKEETRSEVSFSLPGISDDCIIEYYYKLHKETENVRWVFQDEIPTLLARYQWFVSRDQASYFNFGSYRILLNNILPNYLSINYKGTPEIQQLPSPENTDEAVFSLRNVPAYRDEPFTLTRATITGQINFYYSFNYQPDAYWSQIISMVHEFQNQFLSDKDEIHDIIEPWKNLTSSTEKIDSAYFWILRNIANVRNSDHPKDVDENRDVEDLLDQRVGTSQEINRLFYAMVTEMDIPANIVTVCDRDSRLFYYDAKYWQFDRSIVAVNDSGNTRYYAPGELMLPPGRIPWFNEFSRGLNIGKAGMQIVAEIDYSKADANKINNLITATIQDDGTIIGKIERTLMGHLARKYRVDCYKLQEQNRKDVVINLLKSEFKFKEVDSISYTGMDAVLPSLMVNANFTAEGTNESADEKKYFQPVSMFQNLQNPFIEAERINSIFFKYAFQETDSLIIAVPVGYAVESLPEDFRYKNDVGKVELKFVKLENYVTINFSRQLNSPFWRPDAYGKVKLLFQKIQEASQTIIVMNKQQ